MTTYVWGDLREQATQAFGQTPRAETEQAIIDAFTVAPAATSHAVREVIEAFNGGSIRSGWAVLKTRALKITLGQQITATDEPDRDKRILTAEQRIRTCALYLPDEAELLDDFFGPRGLLEPWKHDELLRRRIIDKWLENLPRATQADADADERAHAWCSWKASLARRPLAEPATDPDADMANSPTTDDIPF